VSGTGQLTPWWKGKGGQKLLLPALNETKPEEGKEAFFPPCWEFVFNEEDRNPGGAVSFGT